jgi:hypothetical protein
MDEPGSVRRKMPRLPIVALVGLFVVAALIAVAGHFVPGGLRRTVARLSRFGRSASSGS